ncbi:diguanylate cyclase domain-containing protein, partial [Escherichia coli]
GLTALSAEFTIGEGELMAHDVPLGCAPDEYDDLISGTCSHLPQQSIRPDDILARLEGEVFGLLFTELNSAQAKIIAERMRKNVELLTGFSNRYDVPEQMTISIGTVFSTGDTRNISLVMTEADKALREAKSEGGNKVIIHHI